MKKALNKFIYLLHSSITVSMVGLFFMPTAIWAERITAQFLIVVGLFVHQFFWGAAIKYKTGKFRPVCILTTLQQKLRGIPVSDPKNHDHSFTKEFLDRLGIHLHTSGITIITIVVFLAVTLQFFFSR